MFVCKNVILVIIIVLQNPAGGEAPVTPKDNPVHPPGPPPTAGPVKKSPKERRSGGLLDAKKVRNTIPITLLHDEHLFPIFRSYRFRGRCNSFFYIIAQQYR